LQMTPRHSRAIFVIYKNYSHKCGKTKLFFKNPHLDYHFSSYPIANVVSALLGAL
jgi:hypothetical protein